jgi:hypothetical protein
MAQNYVTVELDTTSPTGLVISIEGDASFTSDTIVDLALSIDDVDTTGYQMKIWGTGIDTTADVNVQDTELASTWISYATLKQITLTAGDGSKSISARVRDDVHNESSLATDTITLDTAKPVVTVTQPDVPAISRITGRNVANFSFTCDVPFAEYLVKVVGTTGATNIAGTTIPTTGGSVNTSGTGAFDTSVAPIDVTIYGDDLYTASGASDGDKIIKVFCRDEAGNWSA